MLTCGRPKSVAAWKPHSTLQLRCLHGLAVSLTNFIEPLIQLHLSNAEELNFDKLVAQIRSQNDELFESSHLVETILRPVLRYLESYSNRTAFLLSCIYSPLLDRIVCAGSFASLDTEFVLRCLSSLKRGIESIEFYDLDIDDRYIFALSTSGAAETICMISLESAALHNAFVFLTFKNLAYILVETALIAKKTYFEALGASTTISHLRFARLPGWRTSELFQTILAPQAFPSLVHLDIQVDDFIGSYVTFLFQKRSEESKKNFKQLTLIFPNNSPGTMEYNVLELIRSQPHINVNSTCPVAKDWNTKPYSQISMQHERTPTVPDSLLRLPDQFFSSLVSLDVSDSMSDINYDYHNEEDGDTAEAHRTTGGALLTKLAALSPRLRHLRLLGTSWAKFQDSLPALQHLESLELERGPLLDQVKLPPSIKSLSLWTHKPVPEQELDSFVQKLSVVLPELKSLRLRVQNQMQPDQIDRILAALPALENFAAEIGQYGDRKWVINHPNMRELTIISSWGEEPPTYQPGLLPNLETFLGGPDRVSELSSKKTPFLGRLKICEANRVGSINSEFPRLGDLALSAPSLADLNDLHKLKALQKLTIENLNVHVSGQWLAQISQLVELRLVDPNLAAMTSYLRHKFLRILNISYMAAGTNSRATMPASPIEMTLDRTTLPNLTQFKVETQFDLFSEVSFSDLSNLINIWIDNSNALQPSRKAKVGAFSIENCSALKICYLAHTLSSVKMDRCPQLQYLFVNEHKSTKKLAVNVPSTCSTFGVPTNNRVSRPRCVGQIFGDGI